MVRKLPRWALAWGCVVVLPALLLREQIAADHTGIKSASLSASQQDEQGPRLAVPALRDGVWVIDGDILVPSGVSPRWGVVHYGRPWPGARIPFRFSSDDRWRADADSRAIVREAIEHASERTGLVWEELDKDDPAAGGVVEIRFWEKTWGSAQVGYQGETQYVHLPDGPSRRLTLHELGHAMGLGHEHQHPDRDRYVEVDTSCVPEEHRDSFAPRAEHAMSRVYDVDSVMHYRSAGFCRRDKVDADEDGNSRECAFVDDDPAKGKCYPLRRRWGACKREHCEDRDDDGFREYIRGGDELSAGDVATVVALHKEMLDPAWKGRNFGRAMVAGDTDGDGEAEIYVAAMGDGACGALWELRPNGRGDGLSLFRRTPARWSCEAGEDAKVTLSMLQSTSPGTSELWVGISGDGVEQGGWVEQWRRSKADEMYVHRRWMPEDWGMAPNPGFGHSISILDEDGDGLADDVAIGSPSTLAAGRVYYALGLERDHGPTMGQLAGSSGLGLGLAWMFDGTYPLLSLAVPCTLVDPQSCRFSLWLWTEPEGLREALTVEELDLVQTPSARDLSLSTLASARGVWWSLPDACVKRGVYAGTRGVIWQVAPVGLVMKVQGEAFTPGALGSFDLDPRGVIPLAGAGQDALIVQSRSGHAWVAQLQDAHPRWTPIELPQDLAEGTRPNFSGWLDETGAHVVTAYTRDDGARAMRLQRVEL